MRLKEITIEWKEKKNYNLCPDIFSRNIFAIRFYQWLFVGKRNKNLEYRHDLCSRMAWQYDSKKFQQESDVICIPFAVPYIFQRDRASAGEPQPDACGHEQSNHKREVSNSRKNCSTRIEPYHRYYEISLHRFRL